MYSPSAIDRQILQAASNGDLRKLMVIKDINGIEDFRKKCNIVKDIDTYCARPLHLAVLVGHIEMCKFFVEDVQVQINVKNNKGNTPLLLAVRKEYVDLAKYFIQQGADVAARDYEGNTCLRVAAGSIGGSVSEKKDFIELLLKKGADIEAMSIHGTPLQAAASTGNVEYVRFLLDNGAKPNSHCPLYDTPLICAIRSGSSECVKLLLERHADPNSSAFAESPLSQSDDETDSVKSFFAAGVDQKFIDSADPNIGVRGLSPLAHAAVGGETEILKLLLECGAKTDSLSSSFLRPIEHAASVRNLDSVRILLGRSQRIPNYHDWSVDGIMEYLHSEEAKITRQQMWNDRLEFVEQKGKTAFKSKNYSDAVKWYSEAIYLDPFNAKWPSNRSICWERLGEGIFALEDAETCIKLEPITLEDAETELKRRKAKRYYRAGAAWKLLGNYEMSLIVFEWAKILDPKDNEIKKAYGDAFDALLNDEAREYPMEVQNIRNSINLA